MDRTNAQKNICLVYEFLSEQGGLEREIITHTRFLQEAGYKVTILTCHLDPKILTLLPFDGLTIKTISRFKTKYEWLNLALCFLGFNTLKNYRPDAFLTYSFPSNFLLRRRKIPRINYINHYPHFLYLSSSEKQEWAEGTQGAKRKIAIWISRFLGSYLRAVDKRLVRTNALNFMNSAFTQKRLEQLYDIRSIVSYPPLDKRFSSPPKLQKTKPFIFSSSRIIPDKKYEWLLDAMNHMKHKLPVHLAGSVEPSYRASLEQYARARKVELKFLGRLKTDEIMQTYANATVFAFPTPGEDFGLVPAESLACGTPVVVWGDGAGPTEQIIDGVNGFWAKPYDKKDFAAKIDKVIDTKLKQKNRKKIISSAEKFSYGFIRDGFIADVKKIV